MDARLRLFAWAACAVSLRATALAAPPTTASQLRAAADADELTLAAIAARVGDDAVLAGLDDDRDAWLRLGAIDASRYLRDPAQALSGLSAIASGRDPDLAPAAARRLLWIAQALALDDPNASELSAATLDAARAALANAAGAASARPEIRSCAALARSLLDQLRGPN
jgi:hypothetical protein